MQRNAKIPHENAKENEGRFLLKRIRHSKNKT